MPSPYLLLFELIIYIQLALCVHHAWKHGTANLLRLIAGIVFGVSLELATIRQLHAYEYGQFILMVLDVPLCIGVAWSCIIYSAMEFSDASNLPYFTRPILDGLLALNIDLALDAVAIRFGFWDWGMELNFQYFGVPFANFWAWFWVVFSFSTGYRLFARREGRLRIWISPLLGLIVGLAGVIGTNALIVFGVPSDWRNTVIFSVLFGALVTVFALKPKLYLTPVPSLVFWVPSLTHAYILIAGLTSGVILNPPILLYVGLAMIVIAFYLHYPTIRHILSRKI